MRRVIQSWDIGSGSNTELDKSGKLSHFMNNNAGLIDYFLMSANLFIYN